MIRPLYISAAPLRTHSTLLPRIFCRHKSLTAAIERGRQDTGGRSRSRQDEVGRSRWNPRLAGRTEAAVPQRSHRSVNRGEFASKATSIESLPYTTAASEFLYGQSSVLAALKANRRKLYRLYVHDRGLGTSGGDAIVARAKVNKIPVQKVGDEYLRVMDRLSNGRPHNGFILEASPLPVPPITSLRSASKFHEEFGVTVDKQSREDARVNGTQETYPYKPAGWRHPLVLYVDGVLDEGNLGAIARSAYFLGVDAIVTPSRQSAPWSHIAVKASAGAAEGMAIFKVDQPGDFLGRSAREGWRIYASDAVPPEQQRALSDMAPPAGAAAASALLEEHPVVPAKIGEIKATRQSLESTLIYTFPRTGRSLPPGHNPVASHPTILMMGAEGTGLRNSLLNQAHYKVGIRHGRATDEVGVDSLNVSVAASLLCYEMLQKPDPSNRVF